MNPITAGLSIFVSMLSALTIIGLPVEVYLYGDAMVMRMIGGIFGILTVNYIFLPKTFELKLYSIFRLDLKYTMSRDVKFIKFLIDQATYQCVINQILLQIVH